MTLGLTQDDFLIYIASTQERAIRMVPDFVRDNFKLSSDTIRRPDSP
jgi:hypothetical protein